jgi:8-oxo-dGTP pyrophosphatase MutT (NUDIX family)
MKTLVDVKQLIEAYHPWDEQEEQDRKVILKYLDIFDDMLLRKNELIHLTASGWIFNSSHDKVLMVYHNIYDSWGWTGGHADGDADLLHVALKEAQEETGIQSCKVLSREILALDILPVWRHIKRGNPISSHQHANITYLLEADEHEKLIMKPDENQGVKWIPIEEIKQYVSEPDMLPIYEKLNEKAMRLLKQ